MPKGKDNKTKEGRNNDKQLAVKELSISKQWAEDSPHRSLKINQRYEEECGKMGQIIKKIELNKEDEENCTGKF